MKKILKKILACDNQGRILMNFKDKKITQDILKEKKKRFCPPHNLPHVLPSSKKTVTNEECHIHTKPWMNLHHMPYCKLLNCEHYNAMLKARKKFKKTKNKK